MNNPFSIKESFSFAWKTFTSRPWFLMCVIAAVFVLIATVSAVLQPEEGGSIILSLVAMVLNVLVDMGLIAFALAAHDNITGVHWKSLWAPKNFWKYIGANILVAIIVVIGLVLLIIPGIIAAVGLMFTKYLVMDKNLGPVQAIKESWRITKKHILHLVGLLLVLIALNIAGAIALLVGLLVTVPLTLLVMAHVYRALEHAAHEVVAAPSVA